MMTATQTAPYTADDCRDDLDRARNVHDVCAALNRLHATLPPRGRTVEQELDPHGDDLCSIDDLPCWGYSAPWGFRGRDPKSGIVSYDRTHIVRGVWVGWGHGITGPFAVEER